MLPMFSSPLAEIVPTCAMSCLPLVGFDCDLSESTTATTACSMPRLMSIGLAPAATSFAPSRKMACASTVAVVVPSPATSEVLEATSFTICAPMLAILSSSSISLATVTPSLVIVGAPQDFSITTFRPRGPRVTLTALASTFRPRAISARATVLKTISLAAMVVISLFQNREEVVLAHDEVLFAVDLHFGAAVLREQHLVARLHFGLPVGA